MARPLIFSGFLIAVAAIASGAQNSPARAAEGDTGAWVKLCNKYEETQNKEICLVHLLITVSPRIPIKISSGLEVKIDEGQPIPLQFADCTAVECQAEGEMTKTLLDQMRRGKQMIAAMLIPSGKTIGLPVSLTGFSKTYDGPPVDLEKYQKAQRQVIQAIRARQGSVEGQTVSEPPLPGLDLGDLEDLDTLD